MDFNPVVRSLGCVPYTAALTAMKNFTSCRNSCTQDEIWWLEHEPVLTLGEKASCTHILDRDGIAVVRSNRGGEVTFHCPGQLVVYPLIDLKRLKIFAKTYVILLEKAVILTLADFGITGFLHHGAPGVYVTLDGGSGQFRGEAKISSIGIRISHGCSYHGISLNIDADLSGFRRIDPCGYKDLRVTNMKTLAGDVSMAGVAKNLTGRITELIQGYDANHQGIT